MAPIPTTRGYELLDCASALQKAIRRNDPKIAGYFAMELAHSGYSGYVWKRLLTISAEDCAGVITQEIFALKEAFDLCTKGKPARQRSGAPAGRIFLAKAVLLLAQWPKNRDADHANNLVYDRKISITDDEISEWLTDAYDGRERVPVPTYAHDVHTSRGRKAGATREEFFKAEQEALTPKQRGLFDDLPDAAGNAVAPERKDLAWLG